MDKFGASASLSSRAGSLDRAANLTVLAVFASIGMSCESSVVLAPTEGGAGPGGNAGSSVADPSTAGAAGTGATGKNGDAGKDGLSAAGMHSGGSVNAGGGGPGGSSAMGTAGRGVPAGGAVNGGTATMGVAGNGTAGSGAPGWGMAGNGAEGLGAAGQGGGGGEPIEITEVGAGTYHTCARLSSGRLLCWGASFSGQLCIPGLQTSQRTPVEVPDVAHVASLGVGPVNTCFVGELGDVSCCGGNFSGQVNGADLDTPWYDMPVAIPGIEGASSVMAGYAHSCAVVGAGEVRCWGLNSLGMLGNGETGDSAVFPPVTVQNLNDAAEVSLGTHFTCALRKTGVVQCWGSGFMLGVGIHADSATPVDAGGADFRAVAITAGEYHFCALHSTGKVSCWGVNGAGELGNGTIDSRGSNTPTEVIGVEGATDISAGECHTCARLESGAVACWGCNASGQLGVGDTEDRTSAVVVSDLGQVAAVVSGTQHTCALLESGELACWGSDLDGELGDGQSTSALSPVFVSGFGG